MVLTGKGCLRLDIWPEIIDQAKNIENMIRGVWVKEAHRWQKASGTKTIALSSSGQEVRHLSPLTFYHLTIMLLIWA